MRNLDAIAFISTVEPCCFPASEEEAEDVVVFELVVPRAAKVPPARQHLEVAKLLVRETSVTSTVPETIFTQLRANDTARATAWCITVALVVPQSQLLAGY